MGEDGEYALHLFDLYNELWADRSYVFSTAIMCAIYGLDLDSSCINGANAPLIAQTHPTHLDIMRNCLLGHHNLHVSTLDSAQNDANGITPLCMASYLGKTEIMTLLLEDGRVNVDGADNKNATPLMYAG